MTKKDVYALLGEPWRVLKDGDYVDYWANLHVKDFFDEADLKNGVYEKEINIAEGLREYRSYNPETNVFICITYMEGDYAVGDDPSEPVEN